ncbi:MAG: membrane protein insertion efficiency factor YidD [Candidatus Omnitrophica bacterium]|nr:membrane protein insertion efficiency factor YidD [Candidatus Omnitrophota bacterium]
MKCLIISLIHIYQAFSRILLPRRCRFHPSCSTYAIQTIEKYGLIKGTFKSVKRVIRCSPLSDGGYDPVR